MILTAGGRLTRRIGALVEDLRQFIEELSSSTCVPLARAARRLGEDVDSGSA